jgi:hypothetical protein
MSIAGSRRASGSIPLSQEPALVCARNGAEPVDLPLESTPTPVSSRADFMGCILLILVLTGSLLFGVGVATQSALDMMSRYSTLEIFTGIMAM